VETPLGKTGNLSIARVNLRIFFLWGITKFANIAGGISLLTQRKNLKHKSREKLINLHQNKGFIKEERREK
jgi:hypothetical protein